MLDVVWFTLLSVARRYHTVMIQPAGSPWKLLTSAGQNTHKQVPRCQKNKQNTCVLCFKKQLADKIQKKSKNKRLVSFFLWHTTVCIQAGASQSMPSTDQAQRLNAASIKQRSITQTQPVFTAVHLSAENTGSLQHTYSYNIHLPNGKQLALLYHLQTPPWCATVRLNILVAWLVVHYLFCRGWEGDILLRSGHVGNWPSEFICASSRNIWI